MPPIRLWAESLDGKSRREAKGIVCDNLSGMKTELRDRLLVELPPQLADARVTVCNAVTGLGSCSTSEPQTAGTLEAADHFQDARGARWLIYYPPDEFNLVPEPRRNDEITPISTRPVYLHARTADGGLITHPIMLVRPTVVLVHGVNNTAFTWDGENGKRNGLGADLEKYGFPTLRIHHGLDDLWQAAEPKLGALYFKGNGPVEFGAELLKEGIRNELERRRRQGFAVRRVDIVAHSYGGIITRWYLRTNFTAGGQVSSRCWYVNSLNVQGGADAEDSYWLPQYWLPSTLCDNGPADAGQTSDELPAPNVRKVITLASPWRGQPLATLLNEIKGPASPGMSALGGARVGPLRLGKLTRFLGKEPFPVRFAVPAVEVAAINSPWLSHLHQQPFVGDVAYGAVTGTDNAYQLGLVDVHQLVDAIVPDIWFRYLALEYRPGSPVGYSDGFIPVWSGAISRNSLILNREGPLRAAHRSIVWNRKSKDYVLQSLSSSTALERGRDLNEQWSRKMTLEFPLPDGKVKTWTFEPGQMAPTLQNDVYQRLLVINGADLNDPQELSGVGRINPAALRELRTVEHHVSATSSAALAVTISWETAAESSGTVRLYQVIWRNRGTGQEYLKLLREQSDGWAKRHHVTVEGLQPATQYYYDVKSVVANKPDPDIVLTTKLRSFKVPRS